MYRLTRRIATGGSTECFLGHRHDAPLVPRVIHRVPPENAQSDVVSHLLNQARRLQELEPHPHFVAVEEVGQVNGRSFIVVEYAHGEDLLGIYGQAQRMQLELPNSFSGRVIAIAARALADASQARDSAGRLSDFVHGEVSPEDIVVTYEGEVKVSGFGMALKPRPGKYGYISPERALGETFDHLGDLFSLGIVLYELTTGTRLFKRADELTTLRAIVQGEIQPPSQLRPSYPSELERIVLRCLEVKRASRYPNGYRLAEALEGFLAGIDEPEGSIGPVARGDLAPLMRSLFAEKLAEEERTGEPALPEPHRVRADPPRERLRACDSDPSDGRPQARIPTERLFPRRGGEGQGEASEASRKPPPVAAGVDRDGGEASEAPTEVAVPALPAAAAHDEAPIDPARTDPTRRIRLRVPSVFVQIRQERSLLVFLGLTVLLSALLTYRALSYEASVDPAPRAVHRTPGGR